MARGRGDLAGRRRCFCVVDGVRACGCLETATPHGSGRRHSRLPYGFLAFQVPNKLFTIISLAAGDAYLTSYEASELVESRYAFQAEWVHLAE